MSAKFMGIRVILPSIHFRKCIFNGNLMKRHNKAAHELAKYALGIDEDVYWMEDFPGYIRKGIEADMPG
ncbi:hypothetical protein Dsin_016557 [Dipteronia sinensis]|uniref:Uncharacterized protein n=1 Tax=Dipteronia sinensis TaxID=43782 RepID=A0AAE0E5L6_9ROSI|nr:hypothetical protein Dsin_016557 [Dipteronia sinensis]